jgi:hypothetical protein
MDVNEPGPTFTACRDCGEALHRDERDGHRCDQGRQLERIVSRELAAFDGELVAWLGSARGRFAVWLAARERS